MSKMECGGSDLGCQGFNRPMAANCPLGRVYSVLGAVIGVVYDVNRTSFNSLS